MKVFWLSFFLLLLLHLPGTAEGNSFPGQVSQQISSPGADPRVLVLTDSQQVYYLGSYFDILREDTLQLDFGQIRSGKFDRLFMPNRDSIPNLGTGADIWVKLEVQNLSARSEKKWILELDNWFCHQLEVYVVKQDGSFTEKKTGMQQAVLDREIQDKDPALYLELPEHEITTLYIHLAGASYVPLLIWEEGAFYSQTKKWDLIWSFYFGIFFTMILYNLILLLSVRDVSYFYYVGYIFHFAFLQFIQMGYGNVYIFPNNPEAFHTYYYYLNGATCLFTLLTARSFLNIPLRLPAFDPVFKVFIVLSILMMPLSLVNQDNILLQFTWLIPFSHTFLLLGAGLMVVARYSPARYFIIGWTLLSVSIILFFLKSAGVLPVNFFTQYGVRLASALEVILFSLGLADRINIIKKEKEQAFHRLQASKTEALQLQEMDRLKSRFFANISHEFRTPLTLILAPLQELIAKTAAYHPHFSQLKLMQQNAQRLLLLINQLLDLAKLEAGAMKLQVSRQSMGSFLSLIISSFAPLAESRRITLSLQLEEEENQPWFDGDKMHKILFNLLSNALKFTPDGGSIRVSAKAFPAAGAGKWPEGHLKIWVEDNGRGIEQDQLGMIFNRFYQVEGRAGREGTGIGLALTKELVEMHHGTITVASTPGKGCCFTICLPLGTALFAADEIAGDPTAPDQHQHITAYPLQHTIPQLAALSVPQAAKAEEYPCLLIVEDNESLRGFIRSIFQHQYRILEAENGRQGYQLALEKTPDLIISDLMMPEMDGIQFCQCIKANKRSSNIPFLLLTARAADHQKLEGLESGADDYMVKPFDMHELQLRVHNLIKSRQKLKQEGHRQLEKVRLETFLYAQEKERSKIASELHDSIGQMLALVRIKLARIDTSLLAPTTGLPSEKPNRDRNSSLLARDAAAPEAAALVQETLQLVDDSCAELRRISHNMMSPELENKPLEEAIELLLRKFLKGQPLSHQLNFFDVPTSLPTFQKINLYRIVQEALSNIIRHAKASKVEVQLTGSDHELNLLIEDNGIGFLPCEKVSGIGLKNIKSRVALMKGSLDIDTAPGRGTIINITVPAEDRCDDAPATHKRVDKEYQF